MGLANNKEGNMIVHEIATMVGLKSAEVIDEMGLEAGQGAHAQKVDDASAKEYVESKGVAFPVESQAEENIPEAKVARKARFWCINRWNNLPSNPGDKRSPVVFDEWANEQELDGNECKFLRSTDIRDRLQIYEVLDHPYDDDRKRVDFIRFIEKLMFTGQSETDGVSREGQKCAMAILFDDMAAALPRKVKNSPRKLAVAIAEKVSLSIQSFGSEE